MRERLLVFGCRFSVVGGRRSGIGTAWGKAHFAIKAQESMLCGGNEYGRPTLFFPLHFQGDAVA